MVAIAVGGLPSGALPPKMASNLPSVGAHCTAFWHS
jgi:hypothetical protein